MANTNKKDTDENLPTDQKIGKILQGARLAKRISLKDVAQELNIRNVYLEALENGKFSVIEHDVYLNGFLKTYARFLGLDEDALCAMYEEAKQTKGDATYKEGSRPEKELKTSARNENVMNDNNPGVGITIASLVFFALLIFGWYAYKNNIFPFAVDTDISTDKVQAATFNTEKPEQLPLPPIKEQGAKNPPIGHMDASEAAPEVKPDSVAMPQAQVAQPAAVEIASLPAVAKNEKKTSGNGAQVEPVERPDISENLTQTPPPSKPEGEPRENLREAKSMGPTLSGAPKNGPYLKAIKDEEVWIAFEDQNQQRFLSRTLKNEDSIDLPGKAAYIVVGNAGGIVIRDGVRASSLGPRGAVKKYPRQKLLELLRTNP